MKHAFFALAAAALLAFTGGAAHSHGGGLDKKGCHTDGSTGDYHCHGRNSSNGKGKKHNETTKTVTQDRIRVIDGDSIEVGGAKYRLEGYDTPETYQPKCSSEKALGKRATNRLKSLIAGAGSLKVVDSGRKGKYGRSIGRLLIDGRDSGDILISEGLARSYDGGKRKGWC